MDYHRHHRECGDCNGRLVCRCLGVTESELIEALTTHEIQSLRDLRQHTGAGDGCTCCHRLLKKYLEQFGQPSPACVSSSALPICSVK